MWSRNTVIPLQVPEFTLDLSQGSRFLTFSFLYNVLRTVDYHFVLFFLPLYCLSFELWLLIIPLVFSNFLRKDNSYFVFVFCLFLFIFFLPVFWLLLCFSFQSSLMLIQQQFVIFIIAKRNNFQNFSCNICGIVLQKR